MEKEASGIHSVNSPPQDSVVVNSGTVDEPPQSRQNNWGKLSFCVPVILLEIVGVICLILVIVWTKDYMDLEGYAWSRDPQRQFKYHPLFMIFGLVFLYGNAIIIYRMLANVKKMVLKLIHAVLQGTAFILTVIALVAAFEYHYYRRSPDMYSLHSWIGIITVALFALQFVLGFLVYLFPFAPNSLRAGMMPFHTFFGLLLFVTAVASCLTGMTEKLLWTPGYSNKEKTGTIANTLGVFLVIFAVLVVYVATSSTFKRQPLPDEIPHRRRSYSPQQAQQGKPEKGSM